MVTRLTPNNFSTGEYAILQSLVGTAAPVITSITFQNGGTIRSNAGGELVTITGSNFSGARVILDNISMTLITSTATSITFNTPAKASGIYDMLVVNSDGKAAFIPTPLLYSQAPTWTSTGNIITDYETKSVNYQLISTSDSTITYTLTSGSLPSGCSLSSSGLITGTLPSVSSQTTYNFTVTATDVELQATASNLNIINKPDVVTWSVAPPSTSSQGLNYTMTAITFTAVSAAGFTVTYSVDTLPPGLTLTGNSISGSATATGTTNSTITATSSSGKTVTQTIAFTVVRAVGQQNYLTPGMYSWVAPAGVTRVSVVCVGGGGGGAQYSSYARGGGGGGLLWINNWPVVPGQSYTVVVGAGGAPGSYVATSRGTTGGTSYFIDSVNVLGAFGGGGGGIGSASVDNTGTGGGGNYGGDPSGGGGGAGGYGGFGYAYAGGGGGAGGYTGNGGVGYTASFTTYYGAGGAGSGGAAGAGAAGGTAKTGGGGGGTGIYGQGTSGGATSTTTASNNGWGGNGGSYNTGTGVGGANGGATPANTATGASQNTTTPNQAATGGFPGGGGGGTDYTTSPYRGGSGGGGAVRIIWGPGRAYPSTLTTDQA